MFNLVKFLNDLILYADMRQGQNSKLDKSGVFYPKKKTGTTFASTRKKFESYFSQSLYCNSLPKNEIKNPFYFLSIGKFCLIQEIYNLHSRCYKCHKFHLLPVPS